MLLFSIISLSLSAQSLPEQQCSGAIPICRVTISNPTGYPRFAEQPIFPCLGRAEAPVWYELTAQNTGSFGFVINTIDPTDDYDWAVYDITERGCAGISAAIVQPISCNRSPAFGLTGATRMGMSSNVGAGFGASPVNELIPVQRGRRYALVVSHYLRRNFPRGTNSGFSLNFSESSAGVIPQSDSSSIRMTNLEPVTSACGITGIRVTFSEPILLQSVQPSDFQLTGLGRVISGAVEIRSLLHGMISPNEPISPRLQDRTFFVMLQTLPTVSSVYTFLLQGTIASVCSVTSTANATIELTPRPPSVEIFGNLLFCSGNSTNLSIPNEFETIRWIDSANTVLSEKNSLTVTRPGVYRVSAQSSGGCMVSSSVTVSLRTNTSLSVRGGLTFCEPDCNFVEAESGYENYEWLDSAGRQIGQGRGQCLREPGVYQVRASGNGCLAQSAPFRIVRNSAPTQIPSISRRGNLLSAPPLPDTTFFYEWRRRRSAERFDYIALAYTQTFSPPDTGRYTVALYNRNGCWTESEPLDFRAISANVSLSVGNVSAKQNEFVNVPILLRGSQNLQALTADSLRAVLRFNARLLFPEDTKIRRFSVENGERLVELVLPLQAQRGDTLSTFRFRAMLANTTATILALQDINTLPPNLGLRGTSQNGLFTLAGVSTAGSVRLIRQRTTLVISTQPNPVDKTFTLLIESGFSANLLVNIADVLGNIVASHKFTNIAKGVNEVEIPSDSLPQGLYRLIAKAVSTEMSDNANNSEMATTTLMVIR